MAYYLDVFAVIGIWIILALSLNVIIGMTGLLQLGHAGFFAIGAYSAVLVSVYLHKMLYSMGPWACMVTFSAAMIMAALSALVIGIPCLRLRGDYLAIATLAFGEVVQKLLMTLEFPGNEVTYGAKFGGASGVSMPAHPADLSLEPSGVLQPVISTLTDILQVIGIVPDGDFADPQTGAVMADQILAHPDLGGFGRVVVELVVANPAWWFIWIFVVVVYFLLLHLKKSRFGRAMLAIREDEIAARAMGVNAPFYKTLSFVICAMVAGLAGALFAHNNVFLGPASFGLLLTIEILLAVVLGGLGSYTGSVLAAIIIVVLPALLSAMPDLEVTANGLMLETQKWVINLPLGFDFIRQYLPIWDTGTTIRLGTQKELIFALLFILLVRFVPNGIFGTREPQDGLLRYIRQKRGKGDDSGNAGNAPPKTDDDAETKPPPPETGSEVTA